MRNDENRRIDWRNLDQLSVQEMQEGENLRIVFQGLDHQELYKQCHSQNPPMKIIENSDTENQGC